MSTTVFMKFDNIVGIQKATSEQVRKTQSDDRGGGRRSFVAGQGGMGERIGKEEDPVCKDFML